jgi:uncharacterized repeat protein (TIGR03803 family)
MLAAVLAPVAAMATTGTETGEVIYDFVDTSPSTDSGVHPYAGLTADKHGNFYGTTENAGTNGYGSVFELTPPPKTEPKGSPWTETTLYNFTGYGDGGVPAASLVFDKSGNLYGTTSQGGDPSALDGAYLGTVFELSPPPTGGGTLWSETTLYAFTGESDGGAPLGGVVFGKKGDLYGTASEGGDITDANGCDNASPPPIGAPVGCGVVYELSPPATSGSAPWNETVLHTFEGTDSTVVTPNGVLPDGQTPSGDVVFDKKRQYIYGTTQAGGANGFGTVYKVYLPTKKAVGSYNEIYDFGGGNPNVGSGDGQEPLSGVTFDKAGDLFGTAYAGGAHNIGMVFELTPGGYQSQWNETDLFDFNATNGGGPIGNVTFKGANLIGATASSSKSAGTYGTIYELTPASGTGEWMETILYNFTGGSAGSFPTGKLIIRKGVVYGTSVYGGDGKNLGWGTVFRIIP